MSENHFFGRFLLSLVKPSQVMSMVKFITTAFNFGYDFVLLVHFFGTPCACLLFVFYNNLLEQLQRPQQGRLSNDDMPAGCS